jgi:hypothetical protein
MLRSRYSFIESIRTTFAQPTFNTVVLKLGFRYGRTYPSRIWDRWMTKIMLEDVLYGRFQRTVPISPSSAQIISPDPILPANSPSAKSSASSRSHRHKVLFSAPIAFSSARPDHWPYLCSILAWVPPWMKFGR